MERFIKFQGKSLVVSDQEIFDIHKKRRIPIFQKSNTEKYFFLDLKDGIKKVDYGLFLLFMDKRFFLPFDLWEKVKVDLLNDKDGFTRSNLYLVYPEETIEYPDKPGYSYIPGYELNVINRSGTVYRIPDVKEYLPSVSDKKKKENKEYVYTLVRVNEGKVTARVLHRLLAITFKNPPKKYPKLVVDHLNGKKWDYRLLNLEWVSSAINNLRAVKNGLREDGFPILVKDKKTGNISEYFSLTEFARCLKTHPQCVVNGKNNPNQTMIGRYIIKDVDDDRPWEYFENIPLNRESVKLKAKHVITDEISFYPSFKSASRLTNTTQSMIMNYFKAKSEPAIINGYEWKLETDDSPWFSFSPYQIEIYKRGLHRHTRVYKVSNLITGEKWVEYGWKGISAISGANKRTVINAGINSTILKDKFKLEILH